MSEFEMPMRPSDFQKFVVTTINNPEARDWQAKHAELTSEELLEALFQHGNAIQLLLPNEMPGTQEVSPDDRLGMFDEIMDLTWFGVAAADRLGIETKDACVASLERHTGQSWGWLETVDELESAVITNASKIVVENKAVEVGIDEYNPLRLTSVVDNPFYVLTRTTNRLVSLLQGGTHDMSPITATDLERLADPKEVIGDYLNVLFYIAFAKFECHAVNAYMYIAQKIGERAMWGKPKTTVE